jgi:hypothetical protein
MSAGYMRRCAGKDRHESRALGSAARARLAASQRMRVDQFTVYRCDQCLGWHVGNAGRSFQTRTRNGKRANKRMRGR